MKKIALKSIVAVLCLVCLTFAAAAQQKSKKPVRKKTVKTKPAAKPAGNFELKDGAAKVATQIKNVSKFLYNLGGVARVIEDLDRDIAARKASRNAFALNSRNKQSVVSSMNNLRAGLVALEIEFRTRPALKIYLFNIQGISDMAALAEEQAGDGQLTESGKTLLMVVEKLSDTLAALP